MSLISYPQRKTGRLGCRIRLWKLSYSERWDFWIYILILVVASAEVYTVCFTSDTNKLWFVICQKPKEMRIVPKYIMFTRVENSDMMCLRYVAAD